MIIKGKSRAGAGGLAAHLGNAEKNERVQLLETKNTVSNELRGALVEMEAIAAGTRCQKSLYHAAISPEPPYRLDDKQRLAAVDALEAKLGLNNHARVVVLHEKLGREHIHVVWTRIDIKEMKSVSDSHNFRKHEEVARDLERQFGHQRVQGAHAERTGPDGERVTRPDRTPSRSELRQQERSGITGKQVKAEVTAALRASDGPEAFRQALDDAGYVLAKGDERDFVVLDRAGDIHSLARRIEGMNVAAVREFMSPINRDALPTIEEAKRIQLGRQSVQAARSQPEPALDRAAEDVAARENVDLNHTNLDKLAPERSAQTLTPADIEQARTASEASFKQVLDASLEREKAKARAENRIAAGYGHGDSYVAQSSTAQADFERRQKALDKEAKRDSLWERIEKADQAPRPEQPDDRKAREEEEFQRKQREQAPDKQPSPYSPLQQQDPARERPGVEITGRMSRLLDGGDRRDRDRDHTEGEPDRQREAPGKGRTRSRFE